MKKISLVIATLAIALNCNLNASANEQADLLKDNVKQINVALEQSSSKEEQAALVLLRAATEAELGQDTLAALDTTIATTLDPSLARTPESK